jgi:putative endonuclease
MFYFYIFQCKDASLYSGWTKDLKNREKLHNTGKGSIYVRTHGGGKIIYSEKFKTIGDAMRREIEIKKLTRAKKLALIKKTTAL